MEKRTLLALALSFLVLGFYPIVLQKFYPEYNKKSPAALTAPVSSNAAKPAVVQHLTKGGPLTADDDLVLRNETLALVFNKKDGGIREVSFPLFINSETSRPIQFVSLKNVGVSSGSLLISSSAGADLVTDYAAGPGKDRTDLSASALGGKIKVSKSLVLGPGEYSGEMVLRLENTAGEPLAMSYELVVGSGITPRHSIDAQYIEANFFSENGDKKVLKHLKESRPGKSVASEGTVKWVAVKDRHFSIVMKPEGAFTGLVRGLGAHDFSASLVSGPLSIPAGGAIEQKFLVYIGPNEIERLEPLGLGDLVNFGKFDMIGRFFVGALEMLQKVCRSYGLAIIALTALINLALFPLTRVSYMSMKRMQLIQPQMTKLREQHKKNPEKLNKEMMELYKKHKVNPFGGCLPMVLQIPIFISLYVALSKSVILINSHFLWMKDLSSPDRVYLPLTLPFVGNYIHLLPLLMVCAMMLQQRLTQIKMDGQDPATVAQQKMMAVMMPLVFGFIFYQMPSGLVLYWLTNTMLMLAYQLRLKNMTLA